MAWRVECRWTDLTKDGGQWRKYADYGTLKAAETSQQVFANPGDIESRIVPLYTEASIERLTAERDALRNICMELVCGDAPFDEVPCDECGGDELACPSDCVVRRARALLGVGMEGEPR